MMYQHFRSPLNLIRRVLHPSQLCCSAHTRVQFTVSSSRLECGYCFHFITFGSYSQQTEGGEHSGKQLDLLRAVRKAGAREKQKVAHSPDWLSAWSSARTRYGSFVSARATAVVPRKTCAESVATGPHGSLLDEQVRDRVVLLVVLGALLAFFLWIGIGSCDNPPARTARRDEASAGKGQGGGGETRRGEGSAPSPSLPKSI